MIENRGVTTGDHGDGSSRRLEKGGSGSGLFQPLLVLATESRQTYLLRTWRPWTTVAIRHGHFLGYAAEQRDFQLLSNNSSSTAPTPREDSGSMQTCALATNGRGSSF